MHQERLHRFVLVVACATFLLVVAGASVTSTGSGLAVPDWPLSFGTLFPPMVGGVLFEHGHRMIAGVVLLLTSVMTIWLWGSEKRVWVRRLSLAALAALLLQAVLGGLTVLNRLPAPISVSHAGLAMAFFAAMVSLAFVTSRGWEAISPSREGQHVASVRTLALATTCVIYAQILLGAIVRHAGAGLAIPDFPLSFGRLFPPDPSGPVLIHYAHRVGALVVCLCALPLVVRIVREHRRDAFLFEPAVLLAALLVTQLVLGALTIWTRRGVVPTTAHVAIGAASLAASLVLTLGLYRKRQAPAAQRSAVRNPAELAGVLGATKSR